LRENHLENAFIPRKEKKEKRLLFVSTHQIDEEVPFLQTSKQRKKQTKETNV
jgi:hypothetical protein